MNTIKTDRINMARSFDLCLYHDDADGYASAAVVLKHNPTCEMKAMQYGDVINSTEVKGKRLIIVDFSFSKEILEELGKVTETLLVIDHHKTCPELPFVIKDTTKAACSLVWSHFENDEAPMLINYVADRDMWKFELPYSNEINAWLYLQATTIPHWKWLLTVDLLKNVTIGQYLLKYERKLIDKLKSNARLVDFHGYTVPMVNTPVLISSVVGELSEGFDFAVGYFDTKDRRVFSLRSRGDFDVAELAKRFGGGGHKNAAGFWEELPSE